MTHRADIYEEDRRIDQQYLDVDDQDDALAAVRAGLTGDQLADVYAHDGLGGAGYVATVGADR